MKEETARAIWEAMTPEQRDALLERVGLGSVFGAKVCVEGVETESMRDTLRSFHVQSFQGYFYAKPLPLEQVLAWKKESFVE